MKLGRPASQENPAVAPVGAPGQHQRLRIQHLEARAPLLLLVYLEHLSDHSAPTAA